ncbi:ribosomal protein, L1P family [Ostertagia ostertagi]
MSKVSREALNEAVADVLKGAQEKKRKFRETVELPKLAQELRIPKRTSVSAAPSGGIGCRLKSVPRPAMKVCVFGDQHHLDEANANGIPCMSADDLKKLNKNKKLIKKLAKSYDAFPRF